jgi:putative hydrolase of the HAD superfamily
LQAALQVKGVLFDLWGTLLYNVPLNSRSDYDDLAHRIGSSTERVWREWQALSSLALRGEIKSGEERARRVLTKLNAPLELAPEMAEFERRNRSDDVHFYPGAEKLLADLRQRGYKTCLVSNCNYLTRTVVEGCELPQKMDGIILSYEVGVIKPEPAIYELAAKTIGLPVEDCLFVGDGGDNELIGARQVGCKVAIVRQERGYSYRNPDSDFPFDIDLANVAELGFYLPGPPS